MSRKVNISLKMELLLVVDEGVAIGELVEEMNFSADDPEGRATVEDFTVQDHEISDSR